jgi:hypothetical protein
MGLVNYMPRLALSYGHHTISVSQVARIIGMSHWHPAGSPISYPWIPNINIHHEFGSTEAYFLKSIF